MDDQETESDSSEDESLASKRLRFEPKEDEIEYFSEPSDEEEEGEASEEHCDVPLDDHIDPSASLLHQDEHGHEEEHGDNKEGASEVSSDDEEGDGDDGNDGNDGNDGESGSSSDSGTTVDATNDAHKLLFFCKYHGIHKDMTDYDKRADRQSEGVAVEVVLEHGEGKKEAGEVDAYDSEAGDSEEDGVEWVEVP